MKYVVSKEEHGLSLLAFLKGKGDFSVKVIKDSLASKACKISGKVEVFSSRKLMEGEEVEFEIVSLEKKDLSITILYQDADFAVVNKPYGIVCTPQEFKRYLGKEALEWTLAHRLDKDTSGLVLLAKNPKAEEEAKKLFSTRAIEKLYLAIVEGRVFPKKGVIDTYLGKIGGYQGQTMYGSLPENQGQRAITHYKVLDQTKESSLLLCDIKTGRTHQIRVHLSELHHPILGDSQYTKKAFFLSYRPKRHLLHAWKLSFKHPFLQKTIRVLAPIPLDFQEALKNLRLKEERLSDERV